MIDDCSNIEYLEFNDVSFSFSDSINISSLKNNQLQDINYILLKQFALLFKNLKQVKFIFGEKCDSCMLLLWKLFSQMSNNNVITTNTDSNNNNYNNKFGVELLINDLTFNEYNKLNQFSEEEGLKISDNVLLSREVAQKKRGIIVELTELLDDRLPYYVMVHHRILRRPYIANSLQPQAEQLEGCLKQRPTKEDLKQQGIIKHFDIAPSLRGTAVE